MFLKPCAQGLLVKIPEQRLGGSIADVDEVKRHPFFADISWERLERKEVGRRRVAPAAASE